MPSVYDPTHYLYTPGCSHAATTSYAVDQFIPYEQTEPHDGKYELIYSAEGVSYYDWLQQKQTQIRQRQKQQKERLEYERLLAAQRMEQSKKAFEEWSRQKQTEIETARQQAVMKQQQQQRMEQQQQAQHDATRVAVLRAWLEHRDESIRLRREISQMSSEDRIGQEQIAIAKQAQIATEQYEKWKAKRDAMIARRAERKKNKEQEMKKEKEAEQTKKAARVVAWREQLAKKDAEAVEAKRVARLAAKQAKQQRQQQAEQQYKAWIQRAADSRVEHAVESKVSQWAAARQARKAKKRAYQRKYILLAYQYDTQPDLSDIM